MPRPLRIIEPDLIYHVINRGNRQMRLFHKPQDYQAFVDCLGEALRRFRVELLAWCLMPNHWHLVVRPQGENQLQEFMRWLTITHVRRHHGHHGGASGHLYQGRYKHFCVQEDLHFLTLCRYVEANALRGRLVDRAEQWPWSSLHQRFNRKTTIPLADWPVDRPSHWTATVNEAMPDAALADVREHVERDRPLGSAAWMRKMAARHGIEQTLREPGRPRQPLESLSPRQRRRRLAETNGQNGK